MSALLNQELARLNLQAGKPYRTTVNGHEIEVRLVDEPTAAEPVEEPSQFADQVMLVPWFTIPDPSGMVRIKTTLGPLPWPDPPIIPPDDEEID